MLSFTPNLISQSLISAVNLQLTYSHLDRLPQDVPVIVVSNHRSFLDAPILIKTIPNSLRIACHHYMGQTPILKDIVNSLGCFPLAEANCRQKQFFLQASRLLTSRQWVGLFPEGTKPMLEPTSPNEVGEFQRGFAHLAWRMPLERLAVLPVAITSLAETVYPTVPIRWLQPFDRQESFFERSGLHPMLVYHRVNVAIGSPYWIDKTQKLQYKGKKAKILATELTDYCQNQIIELLKVGAS